MSEKAPQILIARLVDGSEHALELSPRETPEKLARRVQNASGPAWLTTEAGGWVRRTSIIEVRIQKRRSSRVVNY